MEEIYNPKYVEDLFDKMSSSYARMNTITSFGFSERWRRRFINELEFTPGATVVDLMTGMGECWKYILTENNKVRKLIAIDISPEMVNRAQFTRKKFEKYAVEIRQENVFKNTIEDGKANFVVSGFGLKTFNEGQLKRLAIEIDRILIPGGEFSLIDVSVPGHKALKGLYMFYLGKVIPVLGKLFLKNPESYQLLSVYTNKYKNSRLVLKIFRDHGFEVSYLEYFWGCASGIKGKKPNMSI